MLNDAEVLAGLWVDGHPCRKMGRNYGPVTASGRILLDVRLVIGSALTMSPMAAYVGAESQSLGLMRWHALSAPVAGRAVLQ